MKTYTIKPLDWEDGPDRRTKAWPRLLRGDGYHVGREGGRWYWWASYDDVDGDWNEAESMDSAKSAAEAHYRARIEQALEEVKA